MGQNYQIPVFLGWGLVCAFVVGIVEPFVPMALHALLPVAFFFGFTPIILVPLIEEYARLVAMLALADPAGPARKDQYRLPVVAFGVGFALFEYVEHVTAHLNSNPVHWIAPLAPFVMHVLLTIISALALITGRRFIGFTICATIHALHNGAFILVIRHMAEVPLMISLISEMALMVALNAILIFEWRKRAPDFQLRKEGGR